FGYERGEDGRLVVVEEEAEVVREVFRRRAANQPASYQELLGFLQEHGAGYKDRHGLHPYKTAGAARSLIRSRTLRGEARWGDAVNTEAHPAIVDEELWRAAPRRAASKGRHAYEQRLLAKLENVWCGHCETHHMFLTSQVTRQ